MSTSKIEKIKILFAITPKSFLSDLYLTAILQIPFVVRLKTIDITHFFRPHNYTWTIEKTVDFCRWSFASPVFMGLVIKNIFI